MVVAVAVVVLVVLVVLVVVVVVIVVMSRVTIKRAEVFILKCPKMLPDFNQILIFLDRFL